MGPFGDIDLAGNPPLAVDCGGAECLLPSRTAWTRALARQTWSGRGFCRIRAGTGHSTAASASSRAAIPAPSPFQAGWRRRDLSCREYRILPTTYLPPRPAPSEQPIRLATDGAAFPSRKTGSSRAGPRQPSWSIGGRRSRAALITARDALDQGERCAGGCPATRSMHVPRACNIVDSVDGATLVRNARMM